MIIPFHDKPAIIEMAEERDRKECIALDQGVTGANRKLAQWLLDRPAYHGSKVAGWLGCHERRIQRLRKWAENGFPSAGPQSGQKPSASTESATIDKFQDDGFEPSDDVEDPAHVFANALDSINASKSVAEAYRKIFKVSPFDREEKEQLYNAIQLLIAKWRRVQSTLDRKGQGNG